MKKDTTNDNKPLLQELTITDAWNCGGLLFEGWQERRISDIFQIDLCFFTRLTAPKFPFGVNVQAFPMEQRQIEQTQ